MLQDFRFAVRTLRKNLSVTVVAVVSLALAIAGNTMVYSLVDSLLYRPLPYHEVNRLMLLGERNDERQAGQLTTTSEANYLDFRERQSAFQQLEAYQSDAVSYDSGGDEPEQLEAGRVTPGFFALLGAQPELGRPFQEDEGIRGREHVALLSHDLWVERFGGESGVLGKTLKINGEPYVVAGVLGADFEWLIAPDTKIWLPLAIDRDTASRQRRDTFAIGRLADGVSDDAARAQLDTLMAQLVQEYPEANRGFVSQLLNLREDIPDARNRTFLLLVQVALLFVLLIACANVANLLLSRSQAREREIALRNTLGAGRRRIVVQLFTESMTMALVAGAVGLGLGIVGMRILSTALASSLPSFWLPSLDWRVVAYSVVVTVLGGVLFGLAPVLHTARLDLLAGLKDGTQRSTISGRRRWASNALVVLEVGFALAFLAGASITVRTFQTMQNADPGFDTHHLLVLRVGLPEARFPDDSARVRGAEEVVARLDTLPGVGGATTSNRLPRMPLLGTTTFEVSRHPVADLESLPQVGWMTTGPRFFETLGLTLQRGRVFTDADRPEAAPVAVVNTAMAERYWSGEDPIGKRLTVFGKEREVVGVVDAVHHDLFVSERGDEPFLYLPWLQLPQAAFGVVLRTEVDPATLIEPVRTKLLAYDQGLSVTQIQTLDDFIEQFWVGQKVFTAILGGFGTLALVLAALGIYGVLAYSVARRTHEIGIRVAIGASRSSVLRMVLRQGLVLGALGLLLAIPLILGQVRVIAAIFSGVVPVDPSSMAGAVVVVAAATLLASALPARRAVRVDPIEALRHE